MLSLLLLACTQGFEVAELPEAGVSEAYYARIGSARGKRSFSLTEGALPRGVYLHEDGVVTGTPLEGGSFAFTVAYDDDDEQGFSLDVGWPEDMLSCGRSIELEIDSFNPAAAQGNHATWDPTDSWELLRVAPPHPALYRMTLTTDVSGLWFYWGLPGATVGDEGTIDLDTWIYDLEVNDSSQPDIDTWQALDTPIPLTAFAWSPGTYTVSLDCGLGPGIEPFTPPTANKGEWMSINWNAVDSDLNVTFSIEGDLPDGLEFDSEWGYLTGYPSESGVFPVTVQASDGGPHVGEFETAVRVRHLGEVTCGDTLDVANEQPWDTYGEDEWTRLDDPREHRFFTLDLPEGTSSVTVSWSDTTVSGGFVAPYQTDDYWFPGHEEATGSAAGSVELTPLGLATLDFYAPDGQTWVFGRGTGELTVTCDDAPRLGEPVPVVEETGGSWQLVGTGGQPPYTWSASGLPDGVTLSIDGGLVATSVLAGSTPIELTLTDDRGVMFTETGLDLFAGEEAACGDAEVLACGETTTGIGSAFGVAPCVVPRPGQAIEFVNTGTEWNYVIVGDAFAWADPDETVTLDLQPPEIATSIWTGVGQSYELTRICP